MAGSIWGGGTFVTIAYTYLEDLTALRAVTAADAQLVVVKELGTTGDTGGIYRYDDSDTTSVDDGVKVIVTTSGERFKLIGLGALAGEGGSNLVIFLSSGDGTVAQTISQKLQQNSKNLLDFMDNTQRTNLAAGTEEDLTAEIEDFRVECLTANKELELPAGTIDFDYDSQPAPAFGIYFNQTAFLRGAGMGQTILKNTSATAAGVRCASSYMTVRDFSIDCDGGSGEAFRQGGQYSKTENLVILNKAGASYAFIVDGSTNATIDTVTMLNVSNGLSFSATNPTNYVSLNAISIEPSSGKAVLVGANSTAIKLGNLYIEPTNDAGNLEKPEYITNSSTITHPGFCSEIGGTHTLTDNGYFEVNNSKNVSYRDGYVSHSGTANKILFYMTGTANYGISYSGMDIRSTKTGMTIIDNAATNSYGMSVRDIVTTLTSAADGVIHTNKVTGFVMENWKDSSAASVHTINASEAVLINVDGSIAITDQDNQILINCTGAISGTGEDTAIKLNCTDSTAKAWIGNKNDTGGIRVHNTHATFSDQNYISYVGRAAGTDFNHIYALSGVSGACFVVRGDGNVTNTNNSYGAISDIKLKDIIGPANSCWDKFLKYEFVNYSLKNDPNKKKLLGLVYQQAKAVSPGVTYETEDFEYVDAIDETGKPIKVKKSLGTVTGGVAYSVVTLQAEVVVQEAQKRIMFLENTLSSVLQEFKELKAEVDRLKRS